MKSIIFKESLLVHDHIDEVEREIEEVEVSQIYYGDKVMIVRGGTGDLNSRIVVYNSVRLPKAQTLLQLKAKNTNIEKWLFKVVDPQHRPRKALEFGDTLALKNLWDGRYLRINTDKLSQKCFGC